jgi:hypothetical protein
VVRHRDDQYEARLRRIVANSADCIPEATAAYLKNLAAGGRWEAKAQILQDTSVDLSALWEKHDNGQCTAELLQRIYNDSQTRLAENRPAMERFSLLIDRLVVAGISLAGILQQRLERHS